MNINWGNVLTAVSSGVFLWLLTTVAPSFFRKHGMRIYRLPNPPHESSSHDWYGFFIRNINRSKANNVELFINSSAEKIEFRPPLSYTRSDIDEKITAIQINSFPAKSQHEFWIKTPYYPGMFNATADGTTIEEDFAERILRDWRGWHRVAVYLGIMFLFYVTFISTINFITQNSTNNTSHAEQTE